MMIDLPPPLSPPPWSSWELVIFIRLRTSFFCFQKLVLMLHLRIIFKVVLLLLTPGFVLGLFVFFL